MFGRNELGLHRLHDWIDHYLNAPTDTAVVCNAAVDATKGLGGRTAKGVRALQPKARIR